MKKIIVLIMVLLLSGCGGTIYEHDMKLAKELCEPHDGLKYLYLDFTTGFSARCNNGLKLTFSDLKSITR